MRISSRLRVFRPRGVWAALGLVACLACSAPPEVEDGSRPVLLLAVDGLEWGVLAPLLATGELPTIAGWIESGQAGLLQSMKPTKSPVIWTTIATGKTPDEHGILDFIRRGDGGAQSLYTRLDRKVPALWNIATAAERSTAVIGWWMTHPVEPIRGVMFAQTNSLPGQGGARGALWKGAPDLKLPDQVYPEALRPLLASAVATVNGELDERLVEVFGDLDFSDAPLVERLWAASRWSLRADAIYIELLNRLLDPPDASFDLVMLYLGGADVLGHRFWRYSQPEAFDHPPSVSELERFGEVISDYYRFLDSVFAGLAERGASGWDILVVSDHGMQAHHPDRAFDDASEGLGKLTSGHHFQAPPGVLIATGPDFRHRALAAEMTALTVSELRTVGGVFDVAPTVLSLLGLPTAADMSGRAMTNLFARPFLDRERPPQVASYDTEQSAREAVETVDGEESERLEQLRDLGYID